MYSRDCARSLRPVPYTPGLRTLKNLLAAVLVPVGRTLYVYGGGWNREDTGAGPQAVTIGLPRSWVEFFRRQDVNFRYRDDGCPERNFYPSDGVNRWGWAGADCSGYLGWAVYQVMHTRDGCPGYVCPSTRMARHLAENLGLGVWRRGADGHSFRPGDIFSMTGHVWMCLGACRDGSLVILHSTPSPSRNGCPGGGVQLSGVGEGPDCQAMALSRRYMAEYCPEWSSRYEAVWKPLGEYTALTGPDTGHFSWYPGPAGLMDPEGYARMDAEEILMDLYGPWGTP